VVAVCRALGMAPVLQGGNTGLVGGGVPLHDEVLLSLRRLQTLERVDSLAGQVTAGAGVSLSARHNAAGWAYGVDLALTSSRCFDVVLYEGGPTLRRPVTWS